MTIAFEYNVVNRPRDEQRIYRTANGDRGRWSSTATAATAAVFQVYTISRQIENRLFCNDIYLPTNHLYKIVRIEQAQRDVIAYIICIAVWGDWSETNFYSKIHLLRTSVRDYNIVVIIYSVLGFGFSIWQLMILDFCESICEKLTIRTILKWQILPYIEFEISIMHDLYGSKIRWT